MSTLDLFLTSLIGLLMIFGALYEALTVASPLYVLGMGFMGLFMIIWPLIVTSLSE